MFPGNEIAGGRPLKTARRSACSVGLMIAVAWAGPAGNPPAPMPEPDGSPKPRFISFAVPADGGGELTALRVRLEELYPQKVCCSQNLSACVSSEPCTVDDDCLNGRICVAHLASFEGQHRYVNSYSGTTTCPDIVHMGTSYRCARLGCQPEYRDWAGELGGETIHVTGDTVAPLGSYSVSQIAESCGPGPEADSCEIASPSLAVATGVWADVGSGGYGPPDGVTNVIDVGLVFDKIRAPDAAFDLTEQACWLKHQFPDPVGNPINTIDLGTAIDAVKGFRYSQLAVDCP